MLRVLFWTQDHLLSPSELSIIGGAGSSVCVEPWDNVLSASHFVTWSWIGQLWVACVKVSWLSKQPGGLSVCLCAFDQTLLYVCIRVCVRLWDTVLSFSSSSCSGFWVMADSTQTPLNNTHVWAHTLFPSSKPSLTTPTTTNMAAYSALPRRSLCVLMAAPLICDFIKGTDS